MNKEMIRIKVKMIYTKHNQIGMDIVGFVPQVVGLREDLAVNFLGLGLARVFFSLGGRLPDLI